MVFFNYSTMQMAAKVVFYGPGLCGKTTNLQYIYGHTSNDSRGEMVSLETETDRTLFFDLLPIDVGSIAGFSTRIQLYTVPGQVFYNTTRKLVLKGVDGVVFVADSQRPMLQANIDSFKNLEENFTEMGLSVDTIPLVLQYNKRDLADICSVEELNAALNRGNWPYFEASALTGEGVFETLKGISKFTLMSLKQRLQRGASPSGPAARPGVPMRRPGAPAAPAPTPSGPSTSASSGPGPAGATAAAVAAPAPVGAPAPAPAAVAAAPAGPGHAAPAPQPAQAGGGQSQAQSEVAAAPVAVPAAAPAPRPVPPRPAPAQASGGKGTLDVLAELEKIRRQTLAVPSSSPPPVARPSSSALANGAGDITRDVKLSLRRSDFARTRRFLVNLQVEDGEHQIVDAIRGLQVDVGDLGNRDRVVVRLNIALDAKE